MLSECLVTLFCQVLLSGQEITVCCLTHKTVVISNFPLGHKALNIYSRDYFLNRITLWVKHDDFQEKRIANFILQLYNSYYGVG